MTIDAELLEAGARWRASLDRDPSLDELFAPPMRRRVWPVLAAAALVVVASVAASIVASRHTSDPVAAPRDCASRFVATLTPVPNDVPTADVHLVYGGTAPCKVSLQIASVDLVRRGAPDVVSDYSGQTTVSSRPFTVRPGEGYTTTITWSSYCGNAPVTGLRVHLRGTTTGALAPGAGLTEPPCRRGSTDSVLVTGMMPDFASATLRVGIRFLGGPWHDPSPLFAGKVVVHLVGSSEPYRTGLAPGGGRVNLLVASSYYTVTASIPEEPCSKPKVNPQPGSVRVVTVICAVP